MPEISEAELAELREAKEALQWVEEYISVKGDFAGEVSIYQWNSGTTLVQLTDCECSLDARGESVLGTLQSAIEKFKAAMSASEEP